MTVSSLELLSDGTDCMQDEKEKATSKENKRVNDIFMVRKDDFTLDFWQEVFMVSLIAMPDDFLWMFNSRSIFF